MNAFGAVPVSYIADGHHRAASAARVARLRRERNPQHTGAEDYNWFLSVLFPASELKILPYNRLVADLNGRSPEAFLAEVKAKFGTSPSAVPEPSKPGQVSMYLGGQWHGPACPVDPQGGSRWAASTSASSRNKLLARSSASTIPGAIRN